ncbi:putative cytosolic protein [Coxiella burnetii str. Namibia]|nr:putative cytosolic protein [Coxiella burnetii str. Namibia]
MTRSPISFYKKIVVYKKVKIKKIFTKVNYFISVILPKLGEIMQPQSIINPPGIFSSPSQRYFHRALELPFLFTTALPSDTNSSKALSLFLTTLKPRRYILPPLPFGAWGKLSPEKKVKRTMLWS